MLFLLRFFDDRGSTYLPARLLFLDLFDLYALVAIIDDVETSTVCRCLRLIYRLFARAR